MSAGIIETLSTIGNHVAWDSLKSVIETKKVATREEAYLTFSTILKISNALKADRASSSSWQNFLEQGSFSIEGSDHQYDFKSILSLFKEGKKEFQISWIKICPDSDLTTLAEDINAIGLDSLGQSPGVLFFQHVLKAPFVWGMVARSGDIPVAGFYGTYVEDLQLFHVNFIGRKVNYPNLHTIESFQNQIGALQERFPNLKGITLLVHEENTHAKAIYESNGFVQLEYLPHADPAEAKFFFGKKLQEDAVFPTYEAFKQVYDATRKPFLG